MKVCVSTFPVIKAKADCVAVFVGEKGKSREVERCDIVLRGFLRKAIKRQEFEGKAGQTLIYPTHEKLPAFYVALVGVGKVEDLTPFLLRKSAATVAKALKKKGIKTIAVSVSKNILAKKPLEHVAQGIVEGVQLGIYEFLTYKSEKEQKKARKIEELTFLVSKKDTKTAEKAMQIGFLFSQGTSFARDLVNEPASHMTPTKLAEIAVDLAKKNKGVTCQVFDKKQIEKMGMHAFLSVNRGSTEPPKLIKLTYKSPKSKKRVFIIGKGITFDTGGLSLKPSKGMEAMKCDMAGAASVLGFFSAISQLKPSVEAIGLIAATDNMPSGTAIKPGDVVKALNGKTIEVLNTDAEGRMTLADMLSYASKDKPDAIVDIATLTGACLAALGQQIAGVFGNNEKLVKQVQKAASEVGEKLWQLPLEEEYKESLKSNIADLRNISKTRYGGTITAALFLQEFVDADIPWVHLDIAGPAWEEKGSPLVPKGGSGFGVRTMLEWLKAF